MSAETEHLIRVANVLAERGLAFERLLAALKVACTDNAYLGFGVLSSRVDVMLPLHSYVMEAAAPGVALPKPVPGDGLIRMSVDGTREAVGITTIGNINARVAVEELVPGPASDAWWHIVDPLVRAAGGVMMNRTKFLTHPYASLSVKYPNRTGSDEAAFAKLVDEHMERIALPATQRALWKRLYPVSGIGRVLSISTECTTHGVTPTFSVLNDAKSFGQVIDLLKEMTTPVQTRGAAAALGALSATLERAYVMGIEIMLNETASDLLVWLPPRRA